MPVPRDSVPVIDKFINNYRFQAVVRRGVWLCGRGRVVLRDPGACWCRCWCPGGDCPGLSQVGVGWAVALCNVVLRAVRVQRGRSSCTRALGHVLLNQMCTIPFREAGTCHRLRFAFSTHSWLLAAFATCAGGLVPAPAYGARGPAIRWPPAAASAVLRARRRVRPRRRSGGRAWPGAAAGQHDRWCAARGHPAAGAVGRRTQEAQHRAGWVWGVALTVCLQAR